MAFTDEQRDEYVALTKEYYVAQRDWLAAKQKYDPAERRMVQAGMGLMRLNYEVGDVDAEEQEELNRVAATALGWDFDTEPSLAPLRKIMQRRKGESPAVAAPNN